MSRVPVRIAAVVLALSACATSRHGMPPHEALSGIYSFTATFAGDAASGTVEFHEAANYPVRYRFTSSHGACEGVIRTLPGGRLNLSCGPLSLEFMRDGVVVEEDARATLQRTEMVRGPDRCLEYASDPRTGARTCVVTEPTLRERTQQLSGSAEFRRESARR